MFCLIEDITQYITYTCPVSAPIEIVIVYMLQLLYMRIKLQDMYQKFLDGEDISKVSKEKDPFWEPTEDVLIGSANVFLQSLSYALDFEDKITITDYKGQEEGHVLVHVTPCQKDGKMLEEDAFVDDPTELQGKPYHFKVHSTL